MPEVLPTPEQSDYTDETVVEVPTAEGLLRVELDHDMGADKVVRHEFFLDGKKITKKKATGLKKPT